MHSLKYRLMDGIKSNQENPDTFDIPSVTQKKSLEIGDFVKLGFLERPTTYNKNDTGGERMWLKVTEIQRVHRRGKYIQGEFRAKGTLDNDPVFMPLKHGEVVQFQQYHILDILKKQEN